MTTYDRRMARGTTRGVALLTFAAALAVGAEARGQSRRGAHRERSAELACVPGAQLSCACRGGREGIQVCDGSGARLLPCECDEPAAPPGDSVRGSEPVHPVGATPAASVSPATPWARNASLAPAPSGMWYGWQVLLCDLAAEGFGVAAVLSRSAILLVPSGALHALGGPIVHWSHGNAGRGFASLGLRLGLPLVGALIGAAANNGSSAPAIVGGAAGSVVSIALDIAWLAREPRSPALSASRTPGVFASVTQQGAALGVAGSF